MRIKKRLLIPAVLVLCLLVAGGAIYARHSSANTGREYTCTFSVRCDTAIAHLADIDAAKQYLLPESGEIFPATKVSFLEGENVFDVLLREMQNARIHLEFVNTPAYNAAYIEGINNLYEFDAGPLSGWMYRVNGEYPGYGCSFYQLAEGDVVEWLYTCDLGADIGGEDAAGQQMIAL